MKSKSTSPWSDQASLRRLLVVLGALGGLFLWPSCSNDGSGETLCEGGSEVFCRCPGGRAGTKRCSDDGSGYGDCRVSSGDLCGSDISSGPSSSSSSSSSSGSSGSGGTPLYGYCESDSDCESGVCPMRFCTKKCKKYEDCLPNAECVEFGGSKLCRPKCKNQDDCAQYKTPSQCGFAPAIDDFGVTVCSDWGNNLAFPYDGWECQSDSDCNLGIFGTGRVCGNFANTCVGGCYSKADCPAGKSCSSNGSSLGSCN
jgi:hypothetical protein